MRYSLIVPIYNRPEEARELLQSLAAQTFRDFELLLIEDGSQHSSQAVAETFREQLPSLRYFYKENTGAGPSRNYGFQRAQGDYFIVLDSDCIIPPGYLESVDRALQQQAWDCFGGPDAGDPSFSPTQLAINYSMTSLLTTGGIRGGQKQLSRYDPRSFNLGISRRVWETVGGFIEIHPGEDIDFAIRVRKAGFRIGLIPEAAVIHKRRINWRKFWRQVWRFGYRRVDLMKLHREAWRVTYFLPLGFLLYQVFTLLVLLLDWRLGLLALAPTLGYLAAIGVHAGVSLRSARIGLMAIRATLYQFLGYGSGMLTGLWRRYLLGKPMQ